MAIGRPTASNIRSLPEWSVLQPTIPGPHFRRQQEYFLVLFYPNATSPRLHWATPNVGLPWYSAVPGQEMFSITECLHLVVVY